MGKFGPFKDGFIEVNGVDLSDHCESFTVTETQAELPFHAMGDNTEYNTPGLFKWSIQANFFQDFAASSVDQTLSPLFSNKSVHNIRCRAAKASIVSATNPMWSGSAFISSYAPIGGSHGATLMSAVTFSPAGDLTRSTS